jgi:hypothetical protein
MLEDEEEFVLSPALISSLNQPVSLILVVSADLEWWQAVRRTTKKYF